MENEISPSKVLIIKKLLTKEYHLKSDSLIEKYNHRGFKEDKDI
jgi:hypothetical protein